MQLSFLAFMLAILLLKLAVLPHSHRQPHTRAAVIVSAGAVSLLTESSFSRASICTLLLYITESCPVSIDFFHVRNLWLHLITRNFKPFMGLFQKYITKFPVNLLKSRFSNRPWAYIRFDSRKFLPFCKCVVLQQNSWRKVPRQELSASYQT